MLDPKARFSDRVKDYKKYRPLYPLEAILFVKNKCGVEEDWNMADIGSGTGISTASLLDIFKCRVFAVEPNENMRLEAENSLSANPLFHSINGSSEDTNLQSKSMNMIAAFQAFHWFDKDPTRHEFKRIITAPYWILLVWNDRNIEGSKFLEGYENILSSLPEYNRVNHKNTGRKEIEQFLGNSDIIYEEFQNSQRFDLEGLNGRFFSSSYTPPFGTAEYRVQKDKVRKLFEETNENGEVEFVYRTQIYLGKLK